MKTMKKIIISAVALLLIVFLLIYRQYNLKKAEEIRNANIESTNTGDEVVCVDSFKPVCGEDNKTYSNSCVAEKVNGIQVAYDGECKNEEMGSSTGESIGENNLGEIDSGSVATGAVVPKPIIEDIPKPSQEYYSNLRSQCEDDSCCLSSVDTMEQKGYREAAEGRCPSGYDTDLLKCMNSYKWCVKSDKAQPGTSTGSSSGGGLEYFNTNFNYGFTLPSRTYFSGYGAQGGASHTVGINTASGTLDFSSNPVKVYFYKGKILPELKDSHYGLYEDKAGKTYLELDGNSVVIDSLPGHDDIVQSIIKSIYVK